MFKRSYPVFVKRLDAIGLRAEIEKRIRSKYISLKDLYEGSDRRSSIIAARKSVYKWLMSKGKSYNEVARLFDRVPSGVWRLINGHREGKNG